MKQDTFITGLRRRWIVLGCVVVAMTGGHVYVLKAPPLYSCASRIYVEQRRPPSMDTSDGVVKQSRNFLHTQVALVKTTPILNSTLERPGIANMKCLRDVGDKIAYLREKVKVSIGAKDDIISVSLDSPYPAEAAQLVNALVGAYVTFHAERKKTSSSEVLAILQREKAKRNEELSSKRKAMLDFKNQYETLALGEGNSNIILERLADLSRAVTNAELKTIEAKADYETKKGMISDPAKLKPLIQFEPAKGVITSYENENLRLQKELDLLRRELADLSSQAGEDHPSAKAKEAKMKQIETRLAALDKKLAEAQLDAALQQYQAAQQSEQEITKSFEEQKQLALKLNEQLAQYTQLESEWERSKKACARLDNRIKELNLTEDGGGLNVAVLEVAKPANTPIAPKKGRILALALVLGLMSGGCLSLLKGLAYPS